MQHRSALAIVPKQSPKNSAEEKVSICHEGYEPPADATRRHIPFDFVRVMMEEGEPIRI